MTCDPEYQNLSDTPAWALSAPSLTKWDVPARQSLSGAGSPTERFEKVRRVLTEYELSGWDTAYILLKDKGNPAQE